METQEVPTTTLIRTCCVCGGTEELPIPTAELSRYLQGEYAQSVWPDKSPSWREWVISGTHADCWDDLFPEEES